MAGVGFSGCRVCVLKKTLCGVQLLSRWRSDLQGDSPYLRRRTSVAALFVLHKKQPPVIWFFLNRY